MATKLFALDFEKVIERFDTLPIHARALAREELACARACLLKLNLMPGSTSNVMIFFCYDWCTGMVYVRVECKW